MSALITVKSREDLDKMILAYKGIVKRQKTRNKELPKGLKISRR